MILNKDCYWNILDYTFKNLHFIEEYTNPSEMINIETSVEEKCVWLNNLLEKYVSDSCPREAILSALHILLTRDMIKIIYVAQKKDYRIIDLTSKGYDEYLRYQNIIP